MTSDKQDACMVLQVKSCGLEEIFLSAGRDFNVTEDDMDYAIDACEEILQAIKTLKAN